MRTRTLVAALAVLALVLAPAAFARGELDFRTASKTIILSQQKLPDGSILVNFATMTFIDGQVVMLNPQSVFYYDVDGNGTLNAGDQVISGNAGAFGL